MTLLLCDIAHPLQSVDVLDSHVLHATFAPQVFFCKYNDPIYVKMEKLEIMIKLASEKNIDQVLLEFKEYAQEVDVDFVRKVRQLLTDCVCHIDCAVRAFRVWCYFITSA